MKRQPHTPLPSGFPVLYEVGRREKFDGRVGLRPVRLVENLRSEPEIVAALGGSWKALSGAILLRQACDRRDYLAMTRAKDIKRGFRLFGDSADLAEAGVHGVFSGPHGVFHYVQDRLAMFFNTMLKGTELVLFWHSRRKKLLPGILCPDRSTAIHAWFVLGEGLRSCPKCGTWFAPTHHRAMVYCTVRCRNAHRLARWRATQKGRPSWA